MTSGRLPTLRLADELFLAAHDHDATRMRPRLLPVVLDIGLAGALLAELMLENRVGQTESHVLVANPRAVRGLHQAAGVAGSVTDEFLEQVARSPGQPVSAWLSQLRHGATEGVVGRLTSAGVLREARTRRWWGGSALEYQAVAPNQAVGPEARIFGVVGSRAADVTLPTALLAGLSDATGLRDKLPVWDLPAAEVKARMARLRNRLPAPLSGLLADVETAVGAAMLSTGHH
ncbi:GOLPH3/VPS74 family protein [Actinophytocola glycyrrhizae]|uniref:GPP34 family phosphoprotein n=1 Tax=Actinophytocola glycyrrhizae TaxID=2044873 RepID=A0ABV9S3A6_9PSEU